MSPIKLNETASQTSCDIKYRTSHLCHQCSTPETLSRKDTVLTSTLTIKSPLLRLWLKIRSSLTHQCSSFPKNFMFWG